MDGTVRVNEDGTVSMWKVLCQGGTYCVLGKYVEKNENEITEL